MRPRLSGTFEFRVIVPSMWRSMLILYEYTSLANSRLTRIEIWHIHTPYRNDVDQQHEVTDEQDEHAAERPDRLAAHSHQDGQTHHQQEQLDGRLVDLRVQNAHLRLGLPAVHRHAGLAASVHYQSQDPSAGQYGAGPSCILQRQGLRLLLAFLLPLEHSRELIDVCQRFRALQIGGP